MEYGDLQFIERLGKGEFGEADRVTDFVGLGPGGLWKGLLGVPSTIPNHRAPSHQLKPLVRDL